MYDKIHYKKKKKKVIKKKLKKKINKCHMVSQKKKKTLVNVIYLLDFLFLTSGCSSL